MSAILGNEKLQAGALVASGLSLITLAVCLGLRVGIDMGVDGQFAATPVFLTGIAFGADGLRRFFSAPVTAVTQYDEAAATCILRAARNELGLKDGESLIEAIRSMNSKGTKDCHATQ